MADSSPDINTKEIQIDLGKLFKSIWKNIVLILIVGALFAGVAFLYAAVFVTPQYASTVMLYVNNKSVAYSGASGLSSSEINAARSLVQTYIVILESPETLDEIITSSGLSYTHNELTKMISAKVENNTEVFSVTVKAADPDDAQKIASAVANVLPIRVAAIVEGSSMRLVSPPRANYNKVSPSIVKYTAIGFLAGIVASALFVVVRELMDRTIREDDELFKTLDIPVLTKIPDLCVKNAKRYAYYRHNSSAEHSYYGGTETHDKS